MIKKKYYFEYHRERIKELKKMFVNWKKVLEIEKQEVENEEIEQKKAMKREYDKRYREMKLQKKRFVEIKFQKAKPVVLITSPKNFVNFLETKNRTNGTIHFYFYLFSFFFFFFFDFSLFLWNRSFPKWPL